MASCHTEPAIRRAPPIGEPPAHRPAPARNGASAQQTASKVRRIALAGNPNAGKSSLFNALTGGRQHVGNWPGKTVEKKSGELTYRGVTVEITDLPGAYSLSALSPEEVITRDYLLQAKPDAVVIVLDAANLERNLYLAVQIREIGLPAIIALNMADVAAARGIEIDDAVLGAALGAPVVRTVATREQGVEALAAALVEERAAAPFRLDYGLSMERAIRRLAEAAAAAPVAARGWSPRWLAIKLLEGDAELTLRLHGVTGGPALLTAANAVTARLDGSLDDDADVLVADCRYTWINKLVHQAVVHHAAGRPTLTDRIDAFATHRIWGLPLFLAAMWATFKLTADVSAPLLDWVDSVISGPISAWIAAIMAAVRLDGSWVESLLLDGIIAGVGGVLAFVPVLLCLYLALGLLEDSGYMARAAFLMDRLMRPLGLHGKSFLPMLLGFGCSVPAIYATRTLENEKDRILTGLLVPFMSCGARLPVYILFAAVFFPGRAGLVVFAMYMLGIAVAIVLGVLFHRLLAGRQGASVFVLELPPYRLPAPRNLWRQMWRRAGSFVRKAGTVILSASVIVWLLMALPMQAGASFPAEDVDQSAFASLAGGLRPVLRPLGLDSWETGGALLSGVVAKEVVVSTLTQTYGVQESGVEYVSKGLEGDVGHMIATFVLALFDTARAVPSLVGIDLGGDVAAESGSALAGSVAGGFDAASGGHGAAAALAFMVFVLIYTPCISALVALRQELGARYMWLSAVGQMALAWLLAFAVFQGAVLFGLG